MKAIEILSESRKIDEAPASTLGNIGRRVGAGVLKSVGLNTWAKGLDDKADIGTFANRYYREFQSYIKGQGKTEDAATFADLKTFLDQNKIPSGRVPKDTDGTADAAMVNAILNRTATDFLKGTATTPSSGATQPAATNSQQPAAQQRAPVQQQQTVATQQNTTAPAAQPFNIPALLQVIPQMNKRDLTKIMTAAQTALQNPTLASKKAAVSTTSTPAANMTPAQIRATKQAQAANAAQAQMAANPVQPKAPVATPQDTRVTKQATAAANAQAQMAANPAPGPKVWKNNRTPYDKATSKPTKPKKIVAV